MRHLVIALPLMLIGMCGTWVQGEHAKHYCEALVKAKQSVWRLHPWASLALSREQGAGSSGVESYLALKPVTSNPEKILPPDEVGEHGRLGVVIYIFEADQLDARAKGADAILVLHEKSGIHGLRLYQHKNKDGVYQLRRNVADAVYLLPSNYGRYFLLCGQISTNKEALGGRWVLWERIYPRTDKEQIQLWPPSGLVFWNALPRQPVSLWQRDDLLSYTLTGAMPENLPGSIGRFLSVQQLGEAATKLVKPPLELQAGSYSIGAAWAIGELKEKCPSFLLVTYIDKAKRSYPAFYRRTPTQDSYEVCDSQPMGCRLYILPTTDGNCILILGMPIADKSISYAWYVYRNLATPN